MERVALIRTSDRNSYRGCRRSWSWGSHLKNNLGPVGWSPAPLWFGSGFHYAMEDYHGLQTYPHPRDAWLAYYDATLKSGEAPPDHPQFKELGIGMLEYYTEDWLKYRDPYDTYINPRNGKPCVELNFEIDITDKFTPEFLNRTNFSKILYVGTFDRVIIDSNGFLWIVDYKTANRMETGHLETDAQCTAYIWAGTHLFDLPVIGIIYQQHLKELPEEPLLLKGGRLSINKQQRTTHNLYKQGLIDLHGSLEDAPDQNRLFLEELRTDFSKPDGDRFIRRDRVERSPHCWQAEGFKILAETAEMLDPNTVLYPNPTRMGCMYCSFKEPCIQFDDGSDAELLLTKRYEQKKGSRDKWRKHLNRLPQENVFIQ